MNDAGSRGYTDVLSAWLAALGMRLRIVTLTDAHLQVIEAVLDAMLEDDPSPSEFFDDGEGDAAFYDPLLIETIQYMLSPQLPSAPHRQRLPLASPTPVGSLPTPTIPVASPSPPVLLQRPDSSGPPPPALPTMSPKIPPASMVPLTLASPHAPLPPPPESSRPRASPRLAVASPALVHERPRTAAAFRALGAARIANRLCQDTSRWRLCPGDSTLLHSYVMHVHLAQAKRIPVNTDRANDNGIKWFGRACDVLNTPVERPTEADADPAVESFLAAFAVYYAAMEMKPAERSAITQLGKVRKTRADPNSSLSAYYGARRVLIDFGSYVPPMTSVLQCLKGLRVKMIEDFGDDCFARVQAQPWPQNYLDAIMIGCSQFEVPTWEPIRHVCFLDAFVLSINLGARKVELSRYKLANIAWLTPDLQEGEHDAAWLASVEDGWWCRIAPVCSKTDYDNSKYGSTRMWFKVDSSNPWMVANRLLDRERRSPCPPSKRHSTPLLLDPSTMSAPTGATLVSWLEDVKAVYVPAEIAKFLTWHASRVTLASKLVKINKSWERVQTLVRWEGIASARIYGRAAAEAYSADISDALSADAAGVTSAALPEIDPVAALADLDAAIASSDADGAAAAESRAANASILRAASPPKKKPKKALPPDVPIAAVTPALAPPQTTLSDGTVVEFHTTDSWSMVGQTISIPEGAWSGDPLDPTRLRYLVVGLSFSEDVPLFVVEVSHGSLAGTRYQVGAKTVKALMTKSMKKKAGSRLQRPPAAV